MYPAYAHHNDRKYSSALDDDFDLGFGIVLDRATATNPYDPNTTR